MNIPSLHTNLQEVASVRTPNIPIRIGLIWHSFRCANLGVGALTIAHLSIFSRVSEQIRRPLVFNIIGPDGPCSYAPQGIDASETIYAQAVDALPGSRMWKAISQCDIVFDIMGGDSFSDIYGEERLFGMSVPQIMAIAMSKPLILSPQTIGPFESAQARLLASQLSRHYLRIFTRDNESRLLLSEMGVDSRVEEATDVAFRLPFECRRAASEGSFRIGINVSGLLYAGGYTRDNQFHLKAEYSVLIERLISMLLKRRRTSIVLVPHVIGEVDDDVMTCKTLAKRFGVDVAPSFSTPCEAKSYISELDFLVGSRMHATIAAVSSGVPALPLAYSRKFKGVFNSINYPLVADLATSDTDEILDTTEAAIKNVHDLREAARASNEMAQSMIERYQEYLTEILSSVPS